jgi:hypothetical protein
VIHQALEEAGLVVDLAQCGTYSREVMGERWPEWALWHVVEAVKP